MATEERVSCFGGTITFLEVGEGERESSDWICASTSGIEMTGRTLVTCDAVAQEKILTDVLWLDICVDQVTLVM